MGATNGGNRGARLGLGVVLMVGLLTLSGCSLIAASLTHKPAHAENAPSPQKTSSTYTIEETPGGFRYTDAPSGYAITFPKRPDVQPLANNETDHPANYAAVELSPGEFASIGQIIDKTPNLRAQLMGHVQSLNPTGQISASSYTLGGLEALHAQFTTGDGQAVPSSLVGQPGELVVAGDGNRFYDLIAIGGTSDQRQAFFDSFKRTDK